VIRITGKRNVSVNCRDARMRQYVARIAAKHKWQQSVLLADGARWCAAILLALRPDHKTALYGIVAHPHGFRLYENLLSFGRKAMRKCLRTAEDAMPGLRGRLKPKLEETIQKWVNENANADGAAGRADG